MVVTARGGFALLPSGSPLPFARARKEMADLLRTGSCPEVRWFGYQADSEPGTPVRIPPPPTQNTNYHVTPRDDCPPLPQLEPDRP
jgi:hypothetical protein